MIEYLVGPLVALAISLKFTDNRVKKQAQTIAAHEENIAKVIKLIEKKDQEALRKTMLLLTPMSKAIKGLQEEIGVQ